MDSYIELKQEIEKLEKSLSSKNQERNALLLPMFKLIEDNGLNNVLPSDLDNYLPKNLPLRLTILAEEVELNNLSNKTILLGEIEDVKRKVIEKNNEQIIEIQRLDSVRAKLEERRNYVLSRIPELDELDSQIDRLQSGIDRRISILNTVSLEPEEQKAIKNIIDKSILQVGDLNEKKNRILSEEGLSDDIIAIKEEMNPNKEEIITENVPEEIESKDLDFYRTVQEVNDSLNGAENELNEFQERISKQALSRKKTKEEISKPKDNEDVVKRLNLTPIITSKVKDNNPNENMQKWFKPAQDLEINAEPQDEVKTNVEKSFLGFRPAQDLTSIPKHLNEAEENKPYTYSFEEVKDSTRTPLFKPAQDLESTTDKKEEIQTNDEKSFLGFKPASNLEETPKVELEEEINNSNDIEENTEELKVEESHSNTLLETKIKIKKKLRTILGLNTIIEKIREKKEKSRKEIEPERQENNKGVGESFYALLTPPDKRIIEEARKNIEDSRTILSEHSEELTEEEKEKISNNLSRIYLKLNQARNNKNHQRIDLYKENIEELKIISDELANDINPQVKRVRTR